MLGYLLTPPGLYYLIVSIAILSLLVYWKREPMKREIRRWRAKEITAGPVKLERGVDQGQEPAKKGDLSKKQEGELADYQLPPGTVLHNLLGRFGDCIGRDNDLKELLRILSKRWPIISIQGIGGVGKTTLALELAYACVESRTFSAVIWLSARDHALVFQEVLETIARTLGFVRLVEQSMDRQQQIVQEIFRRNQCLIIIDNYETISDPLLNEFILELPEPSKAIVTSRYQVIQQVWLFQLKGLDWKASLDLIQQEGERLGIYAISRASEDDLKPLFDITGGNPLALKWAIGQIREQGQSLETVLSDLRAAKGDIFASIFERSFSLLRDSAKSILMTLPIFASSAGYAAIESVSNQHHSTLANGLAQLIEMSLVETSDELDADAIRYSIHPLTRSFAQVKLDSAPDYRDASRKRYVDFFLKYAEKNSDWTDWRGLEAIEREWANMLQAMKLCRSNHFLKEYMLFRSVLSNFLWMHGYWEFAIESGKTAVQFARESGEQGTLSELLQSIGWILFSQGKLQEAKDFYDSCDELYKDGLDDPDGLARLHNYYGRLALAKGEISEAQQRFRQGLALAKDPLTISFCKSALGDVALARDNLEEAFDLYNEVRLLRETSDDISRLISVLCDLGEVSARRSDYEKARKFYDRCAEIALEIGRQDVLGRIKRGMALALSLQGRYEDASELGKEALGIFNQLGAIGEIEKTRVLLIQVMQGQLEVVTNSTVTENPNE